MIAVADSSPLIVLAKLGHFDLLKKNFTRIYISSEVHYEIVIAGAGLPGASEVASAEWIEVKLLRDRTGASVDPQPQSLGAGELSTINLARELGEPVVPLDDYNARKIAKAAGLEVRGTVGLLDTF